MELTTKSELTKRERNYSRALIRKVLNGDPNAFRQLVEDSERLVCQIVFRMIPNETDREDLCQDIFIKVYQHLGGFQFQSKLSTWIAKIAYNSCLNYLEKKRLPLYEDINESFEPVDHSLGAHPAQWTEARQTTLRLSQEIDKLPIIYGTILSLYHLQDMSYAEIGTILSLPGGTVKSYLFRARKMLKERMLVKYNREELCA